MRAALIIDHPQRDLEGMILVASALCRKGVECCLIPMNLQFSEILSLQPDVILINYLRKQNEQKVRTYLDLGMQVALLDSEGGIINSFDDYARIMSGDEILRKRLGAYCAWGPAIAEYVQKSSLFQPGQTHLTGHPRFDYYAPEFRNALQTDFMKRYPFNPGIVLINGAFPLANPRFLTIENEMMMLEKQGHSRSFLENRLDIEKTTMHAIIELTQKLAERYRDLPFIIRPHPFENPEFYRQQIGKPVNIHVISEGSVTRWIIQSRLVIQRGCTTAVEAYLAGVPSLEPKWLPSVNEVELLDRIGFQSHSEPDFLEKASMLIDGNRSIIQSKNSSVHSEIEKWFHIIDGKSHQRIATALYDLGKLAQKKPNRSFSHAYFGIRSNESNLEKLKRMSRRAISALMSHRRSKIRLQAKISLWRQSTKQFTSTDASDRFAAIQEVIGTPYPIFRQASPASDYKLEFGSGATVIATG